MCPAILAVLFGMPLAVFAFFWIRHQLHPCRRGHAFDVKCHFEAPETSVLWPVLGVTHISRRCRRCPWWETTIVTGRYEEKST